MKSFHFTSDPIKYGLESSEEIVRFFKGSTDLPHDPGFSVYTPYLEDPDSICADQRFQIENCPEVQERFQFYVEGLEESRVEKERIKTDPEFAAKKDKEWQETKKHISAIHKNHTPHDPKDDSPLALLDKDMEPRIGDVWSTVNYLPFEHNGNLRFRYISLPTEVILLKKYDEGHWIVAPIKPEFIFTESVFQDNDWEFWRSHPKCEDGSDWLEHISCVHFHTVMAESQLGRPLYHSNVDLGEQAAWAAISAKDEGPVWNLSTIGPDLPESVWNNLWRDEDPRDVDPNTVAREEISSYAADLHTVECFVDMWSEAFLLRSVEGPPVSFGGGDDPTGEKVAATFWDWMVERKNNPQNKKEVS